MDLVQHSGVFYRVPYGARLRRPEHARRVSGRRRHISLGFDRTVFEQEAFHLLLQILARTSIGQIQAVFIDQARLDLFPLFPGFLGNFAPDTGTQFARIGRKVQTFGIALEFYTVMVRAIFLLPNSFEWPILTGLGHDAAAIDPVSGRVYCFAQSFLMKMRLLRDRL